MKVQVIHDGSAHCAPIIGLAQYFAKQNIALSARVAGSEEQAERCIDNTQDVTLIHQTLVSEAIVGSDKPIIILERLDGAQLGGSRKWLPYVDGVIKGYAFTPRTLYNTVNGRYHAHLIAESGLRSEHNTRAYSGQPEPQLDEEQLNRIIAGIGFGADLRHRMLIENAVNYSNRRKYSVHFAGYVEYGGSEIEQHRKRCCDVLQQWQTTTRQNAVIGVGRTMKPKEYLRTMGLSRAVVSPYGWGESCHRDYEALLLGCILIKPPMRHIECWPDMYRPDETVIECRVDFADLPEIIERINKDWKLWTSRREKARAMVLDAMHPDRLVLRLREAIEKLT